MRVPVTLPSVPDAARRRIVAGRAWGRQGLYVSGYRRVPELDLDTHVLALGAQQVVCTAPLIVATSAVLQRTSGHGISYVMAKFFGLTGDSADDVQRLFARTQPSISTMALVIAMITAVVFGTSVGSVQQRAFEMIWTLPRIVGVKSYLRQVVWTVGLGVFSFGIIFTGRLGRSFNTHVVETGPGAAIALQGLLTFVFYWWTLHWMLNRRVSWRSLLPGAAAVAVLTMILVRLSRVIMPGQISWQVHAYGLVGAVFVLSVWFMILSLVIFAGVLFGALWVQRRADEKHIDPGVVPESPLTTEGLTSAAGDPVQSADAVHEFSSM